MTGCVVPIPASCFATVCPGFTALYARRWPPSIPLFALLRGLSLEVLSCSAADEHPIPLNPNLKSRIQLYSWEISFEWYWPLSDINNDYYSYTPGPLKVRTSHTTPASLKLPNLTVIHKESTYFEPDCRRSITLTHLGYLEVSPHFVGLNSLHVLYKNRIPESRGMKRDQALSIHHDVCSSMKLDSNAD